MSRRPAALLLAALVLPVIAGCTTTTGYGQHPEAKAYDSKRDAAADVDAAFAAARASGRNVLLVMGANWCHDSRAFAGWMETPRFAALLEQNFETVFVDVGKPQNDEGRNLAIAARFGFENISGTPTVLIIAPDGTLLNGESAESWRDTASRSDNGIFEELASYGIKKAYSPS